MLYDENDSVNEWMIVLKKCEQWQVKIYLRYHKWFYFTVNDIEDKEKESEVLEKENPL